jgi:hypothetical protein
MPPRATAHFGLGTRRQDSLLGLCPSRAGGEGHGVVLTPDPLLRKKRPPHAYSPLTLLLVGSCTVKRDQPAGDWNCPQGSLGTS